MLGEVQKKQPPMGGLITVPMSKVRHVFMSPGPIFEIDTDEPDYFRGARAMYAGGFRPGDVVHNAFSYHLTPGGFILERGCAGARLRGVSGRNRQHGRGRSRR